MERSLPQTTDQPIEHVPVLTKEVVHYLNPQTGDTILDATVGTGGHAEALLRHVGGSARLIGIDLDPLALDRARERLRSFRNQVLLTKGNFIDAPTIVGPERSVSHILLDLGLSSLELAKSGRGFSFQQPHEPLDMRFDPESTGASAATLLNQASREELEGIFREYGEEPRARSIAEAIVQQRQRRPFVTVGDLLEIVPRRHSRLHPATRIFQALRIAVNHELENLRQALPKLTEILAPGGCIAVISFHSLEDRIVKIFFRSESSLTILTKHVVKPTREEQLANPRSRSARLRVAQKTST